MGKSTLECAKFVVGQNSEIEKIIIRPYIYIPNQVSKGDERIQIERDYFLNSFEPNEILKDRPDGTNISLDSKVKLRNNIDGYWPMVDMAMEKSDENLKRTVSRVEEMLSDYTGSSFLLETKKSYHLMGTNILENEELWMDFLGTCLISSMVTKTPDNQPNIHEHLVDYRYIGHSILRRSSGLRITTAGKKTFEPKVVAITK